MNLYSLMNMKEIWCGQPEAGSFCNLSGLYIRGCDSLEYVFSPSMARYLVHLHTLHIYDCRGLKEVVAAGNDKLDVEEKYSSSSLPKLQCITLNGLSALLSFCHIANGLVFPVMDEVRVIDCPKFKTFAPGFVRTPKLKHVMLDNESERLWEGNLNNTVQQLYENKKKKEKKENEIEEEKKEREEENGKKKKKKSRISLPNPVSIRSKLRSSVLAVLILRRRRPKKGKQEEEKEKQEEGEREEQEQEQRDEVEEFDPRGAHIEQLPRQKQEDGKEDANENEIQEIVD